MPNNETVNVKVDAVLIILASYRALVDIGDTKGLVLLIDAILRSTINLFLRSI